MGLLTLVVGILASSLLLIACCIGLLGWLALGIAWLVGWLAVGLWLGQRMLQALNVRNATAIGEVALGVAVITILARLPWCIGFLFGVVIGCIGLGAVVLARFGLPPSDESRAPAAAAPAGDVEAAAALTDDRVALPAKLMRRRSSRIRSARPRMIGRRRKRETGHSCHLTIGPALVTILSLMQLFTCGRRHA